MDTDRFEVLLLGRRAELLAERDRQSVALADLRAARSDASADDEHDPEGPTLSSEWSRMTGLSSEYDGQLAQIDAALARIADGTYGVCTRCGAPIGEGRLEARPAAELCIDCASVRR